MFRVVAKEAAPIIRAIGRAARPTERSMATTAGETADSAGGEARRVVRMLEVPPWGLVGLGVAVAGFFGKMLHDDNLQTRQELIQLRESSDKRFDRVDERFDRVGKQLDDIKRDIKDLAGTLSARPAPK